MMNWTLDPILNSYLVVILLAAALALPLFTRSGIRELTTSRQRALLVLRGLATALILLFLLRPAHLSDRTRRQSAALIVMFDQSRSMQLPNATDTVSRWEAQQRTLQGIESILRRLDKPLDISVYPYDSMIHESAWQNSQLVLPKTATGDETDLGTSLHASLDKERGKRVVAVVLLGDGTQTAYQPSVEVMEAGRELGNLGYPLYSVTYGPAGDNVQSRDVAVENLPEQYTVFVKNELNVRGLVRVRGYVNKKIPVQLTITDGAGKQQVIGPIELRSVKDNEQLDVKLTHIPKTPGQYRLTLEAAEQPGETVTKNNRLTAFLTVLEGGLRVLYLEGEPRQEQKFIRWALDSSTDIDLDFRWVPRRLRSKWPVDLSSVWNRPEYDVYLLGDLDSTALGAENLKQLAAQIEAGKGLAALGGYHSFGPGGYRGTPLADVLPIEMDRFARQSFDQPDQERWQVAGPLAILPTRRHPVTQLGSDEENGSIWQRLKPLKGANRWTGPKPAPGVQLLAANPDRSVPLMIAGPYGAGRVLAFAGDSTWQWWRQGERTLHKRFWRQVVLWLARRDDLTRHDVWVDLPQRRFPAGSQVALTAGVRTAMGDVVRTANLTAIFVDPQGNSTPLKLTRRQDDFAGAIDRVTVPGDCRIDVTAQSATGQPMGTTSAHFEVMDQDVELSNAAADPDQMRRLAELTREAGGRALAPEQLEPLLQDIFRHPPELEERVTVKWQLGDTAADAWIFLVLLAAFVSVEWFLRKRWGLV